MNLSVKYVKLFINFLIICMYILFILQIVLYITVKDSKINKPHTVKTGLQWWGTSHRSDNLFLYCLDDHYKNVYKTWSIFFYSRTWDFLVTIILKSSAYITKNASETILGRSFIYKRISWEPKLWPVELP